MPHLSKLFSIPTERVCVVQSCGRAVPERNRNKMWQAVTNSTRGGSIRVLTRNHSRFIGHGIIYSTLVFIYYCVPKSVAVDNFTINARSTTISRERKREFKILDQSPLFSQSFYDTRSFNLFHGEFVTGWAVNSPRPIPLQVWSFFPWVQLHHETFISSVV